MQVREKVGKSRFTVFFPMICGSGDPKSNLAKAASAEPASQMRDEKMHAVVARSIFPSQNVQNTSPMLSPLDALGPTLYRIAWYKLECPHYGGL